MRNLLTEADGRRLAIDMLRDINAQWREDAEKLDPDGADSDPHAFVETQINAEPCVLRRYLATVRRHRNRAVERGFLCIVTEYLGSTAEGCPLDLDALEQHVEPALRASPMRPRPRPKRSGIV